MYKPITQMKLYIDFLYHHYNVLTVTMIHISNFVEIICRILGIIQYGSLEDKVNKLKSVAAICIPLPVLIFYLYTIVICLQSNERLEYSHVLVLFSNWANFIVKYVWYLIKRNGIKKFLLDMNEFYINSHKILENVDGYKNVIYLFLAFYLYSLTTEIIFSEVLINSWNFAIPYASNIFEFLLHYAILCDVQPKFKIINQKFKKFKLEIEMKTASPTTAKLDQINNMEHISITHCELSKLVMDANELLTLPFLLIFSSYLAMLIDTTYMLVKFFSRKQIVVGFFLKSTNWMIFATVNLILEIHIWNRIAVEVHINDVLSLGHETLWFLGK